MAESLQTQSKNKRSAHFIGDYPSETEQKRDSLKSSVSKK